MRKPSDGKPARIAVVEEWDYFLFQFGVERFCFGSVGLRFIEVLLANRPADTRFIRLGPPAIEFRQIYSAVREYLHATRTTRLPRPSRIVNPNIHAWYELLCQQHVIVAQENRARAHLRSPANEVCPLTNQCLSRFIGWMRLAGNLQLGGPIRVRQEAHQSLWIV